MLVSDLGSIQLGAILLSQTLRATSLVPLQLGQLNLGGNISISVMMSNDENETTPGW